MRKEAKNGSYESKNCIDEIAIIFQRNVNIEGLVCKLNS
jgi:hypothetical protein